MTCHRGFVRKKSREPRQAQRKTCKLAVQTSSKKVDVTNTDERRAYGPMTAFPEFAIPADANLIAQRSNRIVGLMRPRLRRQFGLDPQHRANAGQNRPVCIAARFS